MIAEFYKVLLTLYYISHLSCQRQLTTKWKLGLTISVRVQKPHTAQELAILIQNYYKLFKNLLCLQKLYYA
jgi:hypothetical protein